MNQEEYEKLLEHSTTYWTSYRAFEIEDGMTYLLIDLVVAIISRSLNMYPNNHNDKFKVFKSADVLDKRYASPYYEKGEYIGYRWFSKVINVSSNMCLYVEIHKDFVTKVL